MFVIPPLGLLLLKMAGLFLILMPVYSIGVAAFGDIFGLFVLLACPLGYYLYRQLPRKSGD